MPRESGFMLPCVGVPQPHRSVPTPTGERVPIGTERDTKDQVRMPQSGFVLPRDGTPTAAPPAHSHWRAYPHRD